ncbi:acyl-coenzyme A thioesterase 13-like protein [Leptotrombidium deliense]|uniref:Acyl-coenzyme A thioesterase 13 n=1 Tax=Leptotrombidium deliense TaxID=299467 RepID=A0A443S7Z9_9ACAR|nr:acyl-coenzyme A thioesterase 13-like protein [Leptotrombidium deliense]
MTKSLQVVRETLKRLIALQRFDRVLDKLEITSYERGKLTAQLVVADEHANRSGTLHGGMTATAVDQITTLALMAESQLKNGEISQPGVSVELSTTFIRPAKIGETIEFTAYVISKGKNMAFTRVDITNKNTGKLIAKGSHTKFMNIPQ